VVYNVTLKGLTCSSTIGPFSEKQILQGVVSFLLFRGMSWMDVELSGMFR
jgi:hypothetical protein